MELTTKQARRRPTKMSKLKTLHALPVFFILAGVLPGCATSGKCESGGCSGDAKITTNVRTLFGQHPELGPPNLINVRTLDHVVYLSGEVSAGEFSAVAESVAHEAPGVVRVVNSIAVTH
jgi:osmotically-inducible protein OsmY